MKLNNPIPISIIVFLDILSVPSPNRVGITRSLHQCIPVSNLLGNRNRRRCYCKAFRLGSRSMHHYNLYPTMDFCFGTNLKQILHILAKNHSSEYQQGFADGAVKADENINGPNGNVLISNHPSDVSCPLVLVSTIAMGI
jgi:hypothetical protein